MLYEEISGAIIGAFYDVYNSLGFGFLERVYENALVHLIHRRGLRVQQQAPISVFFDGVVVGEYFADLLVEDKVIVELKTVERLQPAHTAQIMNYLKATNIEVGLLLNFGREATYKRVYFSNDRKTGSQPH